MKGEPEKTVSDFARASRSCGGRSADRSPEYYIHLKFSIPVACSCSRSWASASASARTEGKARGVHAGHRRYLRLLPGHVPGALVVARRALPRLAGGLAAEPRPWAHRRVRRLPAGPVVRHLDRDPGCPRSPGWRAGGPRRRTERGRRPRERRPRRRHPPCGSRGEASQPGILDRYIATMYLRLQC